MKSKPLRLEKTCKRVVLVIKTALVSPPLSSFWQRFRFVIRRISVELKLGSSNTKVSVCHPRGLFYQRSRAVAVKYFVKFKAFTEVSFRCFIDVNLNCLASRCIIWDLFNRKKIKHEILTLFGYFSVNRTCLVKYFPQLVKCFRIFRLSVEIDLAMHHDNSLIYLSQQGNNISNL